MYKINGSPINFSSAKEIAAGGEGRILEHPSNKSQVLKIYHTPKSGAFANHLVALKSLSDNFVKPIDIIFDDVKNNLVGFSMNYVNFNDYFIFNKLFNKAFCSSNNITKSFKISVLEDLKKSLEALHSQNIQVGDLNQYNMFFNMKGEVLFVDVDSYQTPFNKHSGVLLDDIRDFTTLEINNLTDSWSFDILSFWSLTHCHPFKWVLPGNSESLEYRIKASKSYLTATGIKIPALYEPIVPPLLDQFKMVFGGRRFMVDFTGASPMQTNRVVVIPLTSQSLRIRELYKDVTHVNAARDQVAIKIKGKQWMLVETNTMGFTREIMISAFELYPGNKKVVAVNGDTLHNFKTYGDPKYYYVDGSLSVLDYSNDTQYNYNIDGQIAGTIDFGIVSMFARAVTYTDAPIQNFGKLKSLNIPSGRNQTLITLQETVKNAHYSNGYVGEEFIKNNKVEFSIKSPSGKIVFLDYFPYFSSNGNMVFVPDDAKIVVYSKDLQPIVTLDAPMCTKDSRLYSTTSGIMLLENNTLYLLNTK